jgi:signal transduction histidine kinase
MKLPRFRKARTRLALSGALLSALLLSLLALGTRTLIRSMAFSDIDDELYTLSVALGSSFELEGLVEARRDTLKAGLEANAFEFRLANHDAILFSGDTPVAASGNLLRSGGLPGGIGPYRGRPEAPFTAVEPYSGQNRVCRFLVTHLGGKAKGATLVLFRWIGPSLRSLARLDRALVAIVLFGFLGTATIQAIAVSRAIRPVEEVTRVAEEVEATDLSRRVPVFAGGEEFQRLAGVINSLLARLERAFGAQKRLIADAAHELKTPTAVLVGEAQEAQRPDASAEERRQSVETIERVARGLAREVDGLLLLARGDGAPPVLRTRADFSRIVEEAVATVEPLAESRGVRCAYSRNGPAAVLGDPEALFRVASNLISNAVLYTDPQTTVEVEVRTAGDEIALEVRDRGPGVRPEERNRIFERFVRLDAARARNPEGSGLGLAIVEQAVHAHSGRIEVDPREGGGTVFRAVLPGAPPERAPGVQKATPG